ncbi:ATP-binding protein [Streptomyces hundungensis]|uniref:ATP-binding protein n=1 Tax=Streptomyces hundungensis TaxID=1077946 RepID=UPI003401FCCD
MIVATVEDMVGATAAARDHLTLNLRRAPRTEGQPVPTHESRWIGHLRRIGAAKLRLWGLPWLVDDAQVVISELVTNALLHGTGDQIAFRLLLVGDFCVLEVGDGSPQPARISEADALDENGRGMFIVSALTSLCGVSPDGTKTWCTFTIPPSPRRTA